jgi:hypothetical protein
MDVGVVSVIDGLIESIDTGGSSDVPQLRLPDFLLANGRPDEVWISTFRSVSEGKPPFRLFLAYSRGIVAQFELADVPVVENNVTGCYQPPSNIFVWLVDPERQVTFEQSLAAGVFSDDQEYLPLEEATDFDVDAFFEAFSRADNTLCLETPKTLWQN